MLAPVPPEGAAFLHSFEGRWGVVKLVPADPSFSQEFDGYAMRCGGPKEWNITIRPEAQDDGVKDWTFRYVPEADGYSYVESLDERRSRMTTWLFGRETFERHGDRLMVTNWIGKITLRRCTH
jgi:hypothetical protein